MIRAAAGGAILVLAGVAAAHFLFLPSMAQSGDAAQLEQLSRRLDAIQRSLDTLGAARSQASSLPVAADSRAAQPAAQAKAETAADAAADVRAEALRAGNAVVDRALQSARWTVDDVARLATATSSLNGADRAEIQARLSAAINQDRLQAEPNALVF